MTPRRLRARRPDADGPRSRSQEARFRAVYDEHSQVLLAFAGRLAGGDTSQAEDIVQETMIRAWHHLGGRDESPGAMRPWLFTVARRIAIDAHRSRAVRPREVGDAALALIPDVVEIESRLDRIVVMDAMSTLSAEHRAVIVELYYRGRSVAETSQALAIPVGTVKSRTFYALRALRLALAERGVTT